MKLQLHLCVFKIKSFVPVLRRTTRLQSSFLPQAENLDLSMAEFSNAAIR